MSEEERNAHFRERFAASLDAWKFQVDSYWQRASYFAVFETAALAGTWKIIESRHWVTSLLASIFGAILTWIWYLNNDRMHEYVRYWWKRTADIEVSWGIDSISQLVTGYKERRKKGRKGEYSEWIQRVPKLFGLVWFYLFLLSGILLSCSLFCPSGKLGYLLNGFR